MLKPALFAASSVVIAAASCGGSTDDGGSGGSTVTQDQAATDLSTVYCERIQACAPISMGIAYTDVPTCQARLKAQFLKALSPTNTSATAAVYDACAKAVPSISCPDILQHNAPEICRTQAGPVANGGACGNDWQCASKSCSVPDKQICGTCKDLLAAGATCTRNDECPYGLVCADKAKVCAKPAAAGEPCDGSHPCALGLSCKGQSKTAAGTCATPTAAGAACDPANEQPDGCDSVAGYWCGITSKVCEKILLVKAGEKCGFVAGVTGALTQCTGGAFCKDFDPEAKPPVLTGVCLGEAGEAETCADGVAGPKCLAGLTCVSGVCRGSDPSTCK